MDFNFTDEQQQFRDALRRYLDREYAFDVRQKIVASDEGADPKHWKAFAELGLIALPVPEAQGGFDGGPVDMLVVEPYWATVVGIEALNLASGKEPELLERAARGDIHIAVAFNEPHARYDLFAIEIIANGNTLTGAKSLVQHGAQADYWIVPARIDEKIGLFLAERDKSALTEYRTIAGQRAATLTFNQTPAACIDTGTKTFEKLADYATFLLCAEVLGALDALNHATVEYTKERQQFGMPIARFQALQHRMVDMLIHTEQARSITYLAAARYTRDDAATRAKAISAAKARVGQSAVQLHGGMGVTTKCPPRTGSSACRSSACRSSKPLWAMSIITSRASLSSQNGDNA
ncbi:putative pimeloyl-CoA dehydrogenase (Small subunit), PimD-like protein [Candidatus Burkholderia pumila]|uniref:Pimeloyl-CoA dehydrogenase (Small subunit), PimD-like protein n=1 Tax=Candidatus Burkholderia pumila TaxID=1090375 RepID=A0ABR5HL33_9BURK|nr:putative pimeloyl-CoA dehydrogenase (Small subunit), PimD-like protein [Candidatus Burkholderia pumila]